uniref:NADH-ubiquinone oxidoreductase chain 4 n=1 Tax=Tetrancistrum nebulosi TaxID=879209 RepID=I3NLS0_9PLAT|nr:NADH dehydrogenase subunit 4 [Tetrancistrum nebulosi]ADN44063.1 NADH dehydrogenase subunit 4 [Tetrancistrum nebulosi]
MGLWLIPLLISLPLIWGCGVSSLLANSIVWGDWWIVDGVGFYLSLISVLFIIILVYSCGTSVGAMEGVCLSVSVFFSLLCFTSNNIYVFWVSYEMTIIPLLVSLLIASPYSERFLAGWYLVTYVLATSLPMLVALIYISNGGGTSFIGGNSNIGCVSIILGLLFVTKVPLPPFHSWLPVVHAEASTFVSVVLSGYVMKLGIIGVYRFSFNAFSSSSFITGVLFFICVLFFLCSATELDVKRWLAYLSLSHIIIAVIGIKYLNFHDISMVSVYCLGHGLSAGLLFFYFKSLYELSGSRSWLIVSFCDNFSLAWRMLIVASFLTVASFPPSISFLSELGILCASCVSYIGVSLFSMYLMLGGLVPILLLSFLLVNNSNYGVSSKASISPLLVVGSLFLAWLLGGILF